MLRNNPLDQLKRLKNTPVPPEALDRGRVKLLAFMAAHPLLRTKPMPWWQNAFIWKPAAAFAMMTMAVGGSGMAVSASEGSVPGDSLYRVKMLAEAVTTKFSMTPEAKFRNQAEQAGRRLDEAGAIMLLTEESAESRQNRLKVAMKGYQEHMIALNNLASRLNANADDNEQADLSVTTAAHEVERVLEHHENLVESASGSTELDDTLAVSAKPTLELEEKVMKAFNDRADFKAKMRDQSKELRKRLEKLQTSATEPPEDTTADIEGIHDAHDHIDAEELAVAVPVVNQARVNVRGNVRVGLKTNTNVENESTR